jgi:hypothetical protein
MMLEKYLLKIVSKSNGKSDSLNTWPFDLPSATDQNCLEIGWKMASCDRTFTDI